MLTKVLAMEHGKEKIRANCICPGSVHSEMFDGGIKNFEKKMAEQGKLGLSASQIMENIARVNATRAYAISPNFLLSMLHSKNFGQHDHGGLRS